jgi:hypothetical protein
MYLGLNVNRLWFLNFNDAPMILDNFFKVWKRFRPNIFRDSSNLGEGLATEPAVLQFL